MKSPQDIKHCLTEFKIMDSPLQVASHNALFREVVEKMYQPEDIEDIPCKNGQPYLDIPIDFTGKDILTNFKTFGDFKSELIINGKAEILNRFVDIFTSASQNTDFKFRIWFKTKNDIPSVFKIVYDALTFTNDGDRFYIQRHAFQTCKHAYSDGICTNIKNL